MEAGTRIFNFLFKIILYHILALYTVKLYKYIDIIEVIFITKVYY